MKIVLVGAGSFVFAATAIDDLLRKQDAPVELWLVDPNVEMAQRMGRVAQRFAQERTAKTEIHVSSGWAEALPHADAVILSAAVQGKRRWAMDYEVLRAQGYADQARECGGIAGLSYSMRNISLVLDLCADMTRLCPQAWLLNASNPLPRVVIAAEKYGGIRTIGFCSAGAGRCGDYPQIARVLGRSPDSIEVIATGTNHFTFVHSIRDRATGESLLRQAEQLVAAGKFNFGEYDVQWFWNAFGAIEALPPNHAAEFIAEVPGFTRHPEPPFHGNEEERRQRMDELDAVAAGGGDWDTIVWNSSWEHPGLAAAALIAGNGFYFPALNLLNNGYFAGLPTGAAVEVPATIVNGRINVTPGLTLQGKALEITQRVSAVNELAAQAGATGDRALLYRALEIDPATEKCDPGQARALLDKLIDQHLDILPRFRG